MGHDLDKGNGWVDRLARRSYRGPGRPRIFIGRTPSRLMLIRLTNDEINSKLVMETKINL